jgi:hypothetical protein
VFLSYPGAATYFSCSIDTIRLYLKDEKIYKKKWILRSSPIEEKSNESER